MQSSIAGCNDTVHIPANWPGQVFKESYGICYPVLTGKVQRFSHYGYNPKVSTGVVFFVIFGILAVVHFSLSIRSKRWGLLVTAVGCLVEFAGWAGRTLSGVKNDVSAESANYFLIQIVSLTVAPVFYSAVCYGILVIIIKETSPQISRVSPGKLVCIFVACDLVSLGLQATGGGLITNSLITAQQQDTDGNIMLAGITFQLVVMIGFIAFALDFLVRLHGKSSRRMETFLSAGLMRCTLGVGLASLCIVVRGGYRTAELLGGFDGSIMNNETLFLAADASMMVLCATALAASHPLFTVPKTKRRFELFHDPASDLQLESERRMEQLWKDEGGGDCRLSRRTSRTSLQGE